MDKTKYDACDVTLSVYARRASLKICLTTLGIEPTTFGILAQRRKTPINGEKSKHNIFRNLT
jgi:hypothetical protein